MLELVEVTNSIGDVLPLALGQPTNGVILKGIDGLDPGKATLVSTDFAQQDGAYFHSSRRGARNILMGFSLDSRFGGGSVFDLRQILYRAMMPKTEVKLTLSFSDGFLVEINGVVESIQAPTFTDKPAAVVSIICHDPDFFDPNVINVGFEASNVFNENEIVYEGTVPTGFEIEFYMNVGTSSNGFLVYNRQPTGNIQRLQFTASLQGSDIVNIISIPGKKNAQLQRSGTVTSIVGGISPQAVWPTLYPGSNYIAIVSTGGRFYYDIWYNNRYGGL